MEAKGDLSLPDGLLDRMGDAATALEHFKGSPPSATICSHREDVTKEKSKRKGANETEASGAVPPYAPDETVVVNDTLILEVKYAPDVERQVEALRCLIEYMRTGKSKAE